MEKLQKLNKSKSALWKAAALLYAFMLLLNCLTPYVADDYTYMYSFADGARIDSVGDVFPSMAAHGRIMNGRVISHFFGQLFMLWPKAVFAAVNAAVYTGLMLLLYRAVMGRRGENILMFLGLCALAWLFMPAFGQVALWQLGSVNYLWGLLGAMVFLLPFLRRAETGEDPLPGWRRKALFCLFALPFGMYTEVASFAGIFTAAALLLWTRFRRRGGWKTWLWLPVALGAAGYALLLKMPAELAAKQTDMDLPTLIFNFGRSTTMLRDEGTLLLSVWAALFVLGLRLRLDPDRLGLSALFCLGGLAANYALVMAAYYEARCFYVTAVFLTVAVAILALELAKSRLGDMVAAGGAVLAVVTALAVVTGTADIGQGFWEFHLRDAMIRQSVAAGQRDILAPVVEGRTKYSEFQWLKDLDCADPDTWPNDRMADYYGADSILGYDEE